MTLHALIAQYWDQYAAAEEAFRNGITVKQRQKLADQTYERTLRRMARTPIRSAADALAAVDWLGRFEYATVRTHEAVVAALKRYVAGQAKSGASLSKARTSDCGERSAHSGLA